MSATITEGSSCRVSARRLWKRLLWWTVNKRLPIVSIVAVNVWLAAGCPGMFSSGGLCFVSTSLACLVLPLVRTQLNRYATRTPSNKDICIWYIFRKGRGDTQFIQHIVLQCSTHWMAQLALDVQHTHLANIRNKAARRRVPCTVLLYRKTYFLLEFLDGSTLSQLHSSATL